MGKNLNGPVPIFPVSEALLFRLSYCKQVSFLWSILCYIFHIFCFLLVNSLLKMDSKHRTKMLFSVPKQKKAMMCLMEKICCKYS